ncbi:MAG: glyoxalase [Nocardioidaceae bacterium]|jgi:predicted lactoylglutathione lyase|nr:glyoxalase [Nocardioidaceae bacterium]MBA3991520.1 glyoxalase [Propionibacteriales bacterium]
MSTKIFINLPVKDLTASTGFFAGLGYTQHPQFSDANASCIVFSDDIHAMLLVEPFFQTFTPESIADATTSTGEIMALGVDSREQVDELADKALALGAQQVKEPMEESFMYGRSFSDLDGHHWEVFWMDPNAVEG